MQFGVYQSRLGYVRSSLKLMVKCKRIQEPNFSIFLRHQTLCARRLVPPCLSLSISMLVLPSLSTCLNWVLSLSISTDDESNLMLFQNVNKIARFKKNLHLRSCGVDQNARLRCLHSFLIFWKQNNFPSPCFYEACISPLGYSVTELLLSFTDQPVQRVSWIWVFFTRRQRVEEIQLCEHVWDH